MEKVLTHKRLLELIAYDPLTGIFTWTTARPGVAIGGIAGGPNAQGYICMSVDGRTYKAGRLAWFYMTGKWPKGEVDHWDLDKGNNRWVNLKDISKAHNQIRKSRYRNNTSGFPGVSRRFGKWRARTYLDGKRVDLGGYTCIGMAFKAYVAAKAQVIAAAFPDSMPAPSGLILPPGVG